MKPHPRIRKTVKWGGAVVTVLLVVVWVGSGWICMRGVVSGEWIVVCGGGAFRLTTMGPKQPALLFAAAAQPYTWSFFGGRWNGDFTYEVPLWVPTIASSLLTMAAWLLDLIAHRRAKLNLCPKCNYDRTGLLNDARCPECGAAPASM